MVKPSLHIGALHANSTYPIIPSQEVLKILALMEVMTVVYSIYRHFKFQLPRLYNPLKSKDRHQIQTYKSCSR